MKTAEKKAKPRRIRADGKPDRRGGRRPGSGQPKKFEGDAQISTVYIVKKDVAELGQLFPGVSISAIVRDALKRTIADYKKKQLKLF